MLKVQFFNNVNTMLKGFIRHYWYVNSDEILSTSQKLLLPMDHVDLIMTMGNPSVYGEYTDMCKPENIHFHGIREHALQITQRGKISAFGVTFTPWGFYFFAKQSMSQYANRIINLRDVNYSLWQELSDHIAQFQGPSDFIKSMEKLFIQCINVKTGEQIDCRIIEKFMTSNTPSIKAYCEHNGVSTRKLERIFRKYIGVSPKKFMSVVRFEESARDIMYSNDFSLTDISYRNGYYDQPHFAKHFKDYTGYAPRDFQSDKPALKSHFDYAPNPCFIKST